MTILGYNTNCWNINKAVILNAGTSKTTLLLIIERQINLEMFTYLYICMEYVASQSTLRRVSCIFRWVWRDYLINLQFQSLQLCPIKEIKLLKNQKEHKSIKLIIGLTLLRNFSLTSWEACCWKFGFSYWCFNLVNLTCNFNILLFSPSKYFSVASPYKQIVQFIQFTQK